ncbi:MAG: hypothetical protein QM691_10235 [Opitutaceae bacterium]
MNLRKGCWLNDALLAVGAFIFLATAVFFVGNAWVNADEGFYANACRLVFKGEMPYRDFGYTQTPVFPYIQGLPLWLGDFTLAAQRWANLGWTVCVLALLGHRLRADAVSVHWQCAVLLLFATSIPLVYFCTIGKTYALAQLMLVLAGLGLWRNDCRLSLLQTAFFGTLAVGCRLPVLPAVTVLYIAAFLRGWRAGVGLPYLVLPPFLFGALVFLPFALGDLQNFYFWTWGFHQLRTAPKRALADVAGMVLLLAPGACALGGAALAYGGWRQRWDSGRWAYASCLVAAVTGIVVNVVAGSFYAEYTVPFFALLLLGSVGMLSQRATRPAFVYSLGLLCSVCNYVAPAVDRSERYLLRGAVSDLRAAGTFLRENTSEGALIIAPMLEVTLEAGRETHPQLAMGLFTVTDEFSREDAKRLRMMNAEELLSIVESGEAGALVFVLASNVNFVYSMPSTRFFPDAFNDRLIMAVGRGGYRMSYRNGMYAIFTR